MRIVLDTNVITVAISRRSKFYPIWQSLRNGDYELVTTSDILAEYEEIIGGDLSPEIANFVLDTLDNLPNVTYLNKYFNWNLIAEDPDDDKFVDCAFAGNADFLVTNDRHFNVLKTHPFPKIKVLSAEEFLALL
ncbi:MAG: putative toxin-antitoxin system toxin component, PIN family [Bacteroidetes bacterium]|nr:putative toxin-antitoxin system toxin component, PIN family [Bacteroidota bacterium]